MYLSWKLEQPVFHCKKLAHFLILSKLLIKYMEAPKTHFIFFTRKVAVDNSYRVHFSLNWPLGRFSL